MTDTIMDVMRGAFAEGCTEPYCANNPNYRGTYEAYAGSLCGRCEAEEQEGCDSCGHRNPHQDKRLDAPPLWQFCEEPECACGWEA